MFKHWKNITIYKLSREADLTDLEDKKKMILFTPCGSQDMAKFGFVSPFGDNSEVIAMHGNGFILVEAKRETKILPPPVIQRAIQEKIEKLEQEQARKLKKTEKDSLKDEVLHSLLPRAFSKFSVIQAIYDGSTKRIYINASARQAEDMLALMRKSLGSLPAVPLSMAKNPTAVCYEVRNAEVAVRRLTPVECERLQGFPEGHTLIPTEKRKKVSSDELAYLRNHYPDLSEEEAAMLAADGPRYKAIGNSMAIPVMRWIGDRITKAVCRQKEGSETKERKVKPAAEFERSIFKWAGGKFGVLEQIFRYLPEGKRLIEPFVGGGAVFMNAGYQENLLNDVNADLINFYKTLQREAHSLITLAHRFFQDYNTQEGYLAVRNAFNKQVYDDLHRAAAFLFLNRHCFNGLTRYNQAGEFNVGYGKYKTPYFPLQEMEAFLGAEGRSEFVCGDFAAVIEAAGEGDVIFCDPPYEPLPNTEGFTNYSGHDFKFEEQKRLVSLLTDAHRRGAKVLITNSGAPNIRELYHDSGFRVEPLFARRSVSCKGDTRGVAHDVLGILL